MAGPPEGGDLIMRHFWYSQKMSTLWRRMPVANIGAQEVKYTFLLNRPQHPRTAKDRIRGEGYDDWEYLGEGVVIATGEWKPLDEILAEESRA